MKSFFRSFIAAVLCIAMVLSLTSVAFAVDKVYSDYDPSKPLLLPLGDSIAYGYGCTDEAFYMPGGYYICPWAFPYLTAQELDMNFAPLAYYGLRVCDVRYMVDDEYIYSQSKYSSNRLQKLSDKYNVGIEEIRDFYKEYIAQADYILLDIGTNDIIGNALAAAVAGLNTALEQVTGESGAVDTWGSSPDYGDINSGFRPDKLGFGRFPIYTEETEAAVKQIWNEYLNSLEPEEETDFNVGELITDIFKKAAALDVLDAVVMAFMEEYETAMAVFKTDYLGLLKGLDARMKEGSQLIVMGYFNPFRDLVLTDDCPIPIGRLAQKITLDQTAYVKSLQNEFDFIYVDCSDVELYSDGSIPGVLGKYSRVEETTYETLVDSAHPTIEGHITMAERAIAAIRNSKSYANKPSDVWKYSKHSEDIANAVADGLVDTVYECYLPYMPVNKVTLAEALYRLAGCPDTGGMEENFVDVYPDMDGYKAILWAYNNGYIQGKTQRLFGTYLPVSSEDAKITLYKYSGQYFDIPYYFTRAKLAEVLNQI